MSSRRILALGGIGALMPFLLDLMLLDPASILDRLSVSVLLGYGIRAAAFFLAGVVIVWLQKVPDSRLAFQIGIAAPALFVGLLNTSELQSRTETLSKQSEAIARVVDDSNGLGGANATGVLDTIQVFSPGGAPEDGFVGGLLEGATNRRATVTDNVIVPPRRIDP